MKFRRPTASPPTIAFLMKGGYHQVTATEAASVKRRADLVVILNKRANCAKIGKPTLAEAGIDKKLSSRAQKLAAVPAAEFESMVADWRGRIESENERVTTDLLRRGELIAAQCSRWFALGTIRIAARGLPALAGRGSAAL